MTEIVTSKWRERLNLVKRYYKNGKKNTNAEKALNKSKECTKITLEAKQIYLLTLSWRRPLSYRNQSIDLLRFLYGNGLRHERVNELSRTPNHQEKVPKTYWKILNRFLSIKKMPSIPPGLLMEKWFQTSHKKPTSLIYFLHHHVRRYQTQVFCQLLPSKPMNDFRH